MCNKKMEIAIHKSMNDITITTKNLLTAKV